MGANPFLDGNDDDEDEEKRVVKTAKEKRFEELLKSVKVVKTALTLNDWIRVNETWVLIIKILEKGKSVIDKHGLPKFFVSLLCALNDLIKDTFDNKDLRKNMKAQNASAFNAMRTKFKKFVDEDPMERKVKDRMKEFIESGKSYAIKLGSDDEDSNELSGEGPQNFLDEPSGDDAEGDKLVDMENEKWTQDKVDKKMKELLAKRGTKTYNKREHLKIFRFLRTKCEGLNHKLTLDFHIVTLLFDMTHSGTAMTTAVWKLVYNILVSIVEQLIAEPTLKLYESKEELLEDVKEEAMHKLPSHVVTGVLIYSLERLGDEYNQSLQNITEVPSEQYMVRLSHENPLIRLLQLSLNFYLSRKDNKRASIVAGRQLSYLYYRQECSEAEKQAYLERAQKLLDEQKEKKASAVVADEAVADESSEVTRSDESDEEEKPKPAVDEPEEDLQPPANVHDIFNLQEVVPKLVNLICEHTPEDRLKVRSVIQLIHHLALHDKFNEARDLLFMTHLQEKIVKAKPPFQILFNRALVQLGFAAFRQGRIADAHNCLQEIVSSNRVKELLAQGITNRYQVEKTKEQEKQESRRQIPYHMHINTDLLDTIYLVSAMLIEIPNLAQSSHHKDRKKGVSKHFLKCLLQRENNAFNGPPENNRDIILAAAKHLQQGNWKKCRDDIVTLPIWQVMRNNTDIFAHVSREIQEQGLKTYLLTYGQFYVSLSLNDLCSQFELPEADVRGIINKMIISEEFYASWDQLSDSVIVNCVEPTSLQALALTYAEKMNAFLESTESSEHRTAYERKGWDSNQPQQPGSQQRYGMKKPGTPQYRTNVFVTQKKGKPRAPNTQDSSNQYGRQRKY